MKNERIVFVLALLTLIISQITCASASKPMSDDPIKQEVDLINTADAELIETDIALTAAAACNAKSAIQVDIALSSDDVEEERRSCWYHYGVTNLSDQDVIVYLFAHQDNNEHTAESQWASIPLAPGENHEITGLGLYWMSEDNWDSIYIEMAAAVYQNEACAERLDYDNLAGTAEQYAWDVMPMYCLP